MALPLPDGDDEDLNHNGAASFDDEEEDDDFSSTSDEDEEIQQQQQQQQQQLQSPSSSDSPTPPPAPPPPPPAPPAAASDPSSPERKRQKAAEAAADAASAAARAIVSFEASSEKKPLPMDERRLFQRLWTDEDEIAILQGFLEFTTQNRKGGTHQNHHYHDTGPFYDQIRGRLQLDFNKNQLVEKLRRLKKKYRNVLAKIEAGKEVAFKTPHDQATFEISRKIWSSYAVAADPPLDDADDDDMKTPPGMAAAPPQPPSSQRSRKRSRKRISSEAVMTASAAVEEDEKPPAAATPISSAAPANVIEDAVRSCLSPLFKELLFNAGGGGAFGAGIHGGFGGLLGPIPLNFQGGNGAADDKWRKQQILELEVYSKRVELVQEHIRLTLEELRSMGAS
ncbi:Mediator-associated protein 1 [Acorus calamus]|uniref:Mediator-associated protein 1 n=1 Tax=Acorus calamus TaxID=4465 RepID=A0AAV9F3R6_ACOCL|nr:Mediator-associated protein 1 [Acorus calamus]